jgi:hypothetical protein
VGTGWPRPPGADGGPVTVDIDAAIVIAHSDKERAAPTWKHTFGFHPLAVFADHGDAGTGESLAIALRPGNAGSNTAADHIEATRLALAQLPARARRRVLARADSGGGTHEFLAWLRGRRVQYSVGIGASAVPGIEDAVRAVSASAWTPAYDREGTPREGAWVAEITGLLDLSGWPPGMRVIARKERPHPGAPLRLTDIDGNLVTCFATSTRRGQLPDLELRHRRRARCEDRIRCAKDTGLRNLPLRGFAQNQLWCELVAPGHRPAGPGPAPRPRRARPPVGTPATAVPAPRHSRPPGPRRPPPAAPHRRRMALGSRPHRRIHPPRQPQPRLTPATPPRQPGRTTTRDPWNPAHPERQPGQKACRKSSNPGPDRRLRPPTQDHERSVSVGPALPVGVLPGSVRVTAA